MNCRILYFLDPHPGGPSPIMPVDMAMRICLTSSPPLHSFLSNYDNCCSSSSSSAALLKRCEPLRPCLSYSNDVAATATMATAAVEMSSGSVAWLSRKKKSVVFADSRGLALTAIHVFKEDEDGPMPELQFHLTEIEGGAARAHLGDCQGERPDAANSGPGLFLDFTQPAADYLDLRNRLKAQQVCLETCSVQDRLVSGTVQVRNLCFDKSVSVRITFDSWRSFQDIPCLYLNKVYGCQDTDTFSFSVPVPELLQPPSRVEFCIRYQTQDCTFWDNNHGNNYRLVDPTSSRIGCSKGSRLEIQRQCGPEMRQQMEFDPFGSPRISAGVFTEWQSWGQTSTPYW